MAVYVILDIDVKDPALYEQYKKAGAPTLAKYGGRPLARGGMTKVLEGAWTPKRVVMIEFPGFDDVDRWWNSPEYQEARKLRHKAAETNVVVIEGF